MSFDEAFEISIPSKTCAAREVQERIVSALERLEYSPREVFGLRLAMEEAIVNAIKHGNGMDPSKQVAISCAITSSSARIEIEDEGVGFCPDDVPDPTLVENLDKPGGRGLMLMRAYARVEFNARGNRVVLEAGRESMRAATSASHTSNGSHRGNGRPE